MAGCPHHVTQRGNYQQVVFYDDEDRRLYLEWLCEYKKRNGLKVWAWCLMDNHVHLVCVPRQEGSLAQTLHQVHTRYASYRNRRSGARGHLWQGRYYSCALDEEQVWVAVRYVEQNPVRAGMVVRAEEYGWSSARAHTEGRGDGVVDEGLRGKDVTEDWRGWLAEPASEKDLVRLRQGTFTGRPVGAEGFQARIEALLGRRLSPGRRGRPRRPRE